MVCTYVAGALLGPAARLLRVELLSVTEEGAAVLAPTCFVGAPSWLALGLVGGEQEWRSVGRMEAKLTHATWTALAGQLDWIITGKWGALLGLTRDSARLAS